MMFLHEGYLQNESMLLPLTMGLPREYIESERSVGHPMVQRIKEKTPHIEDCSSNVIPEPNEVQVSSHACHSSIT